MAAPVNSPGGDLTDSFILPRIRQLEDWLFVDYHRAKYYNL